MQRHPLRSLSAVAGSALALALLSLPVIAQEEAAQEKKAEAPPPETAAADAGASTNPDEPTGSFFASTTVTATGSERDTFEVATPVTVISQEEIERLAPDNAADLLRDQPGVDVNGV